MLSSKVWCLVIFTILVLTVGLNASYIVGPVSNPIFPSLGIPKFIQAAPTNSANATTLSVSFSSLPIIADIVIVGVIGGGSGSAAVDTSALVADNQGNSYSRLNIITNTTSTVGRVSYWCAAVTTSAGTFSPNVTFTSNNLITLFALEYSGTSCNPDKLTGASGATSPYSCGTFTTKNANDLLLTFLWNPGSTGTVTYTAPTGFTIRSSQAVAATGQTGAIADNIVSSVNTFTPTFTASQNLANSPCSFVAVFSQ